MTQTLEITEPFQGAIKAAISTSIELTSQTMLETVPDRQRDLLDALDDRIESIVDRANQSAIEAFSSAGPPHRPAASDGYGRAGMTMGAIGIGLAAVGMALGAIGIGLGAAAQSREPRSDNAQPPGLFGRLFNHFKNGRGRN